jgi:hypothetical protein
MPKKPTAAKARKPQVKVKDLKPNKSVKGGLGDLGGLPRAHK